MLASEPTSTRTVIATGTGRRPVKATMAACTLTLETTGRSGGTASEVQEDLAERSNKLLEYLKHENVDKLQAGGVSLSRMTMGSYGPDKNTYRGSSTLSFEVPLARMGQVQDGVAANGEVTRCNIRSFAAQADVDAVLDEATIEAIERARTQARRLAAAIGVQIGAEQSFKVDERTPTMFGFGAGSPTAGSYVSVNATNVFQQVSLAA